MTRTVAKAISAGGFLILLVGLMGLCGCRDGELEEARQEAREAKTTVTKLELRLSQAMQEISDLKDQLSVVREMRDELQKRVDQLIPDLDEARVVAQEAEQVITHLSTRADGQTSATAALQKQIEELRTLIADQQALIEELQKGAAEEPAVADVPVEDDLLATDPNEDP